MTNEAELLTITEAAALLRAPVATLRWWRHNGTGPASFKLGRHVVYRHADVTDWIEAQRRLVGQDAPGSDHERAESRRRSPSDA
jgi:excisionase family DNA binding protein